MHLAQAFYRHLPGLILMLALSLSACASKAPVEAEKESQSSAATQEASAAKHPSSAENVRPQRVEKGQGTQVEAARPLRQAIPNDALEVEASCGQCNFGLTEPKGCDLAVRIEGKAYFVDGSHIDDHGDAHATRGLCNAIRRAAVVGDIVNARFVATRFELID